MLDDQIITALLSATKGKDYEAIRDHAIVRLLLTAMRRQELVSLRVEHVDLTARVLVTVGLRASLADRSRSGTRPRMPYGASLAQSRALADAHQRGLDDRY